MRPSMGARISVYASCSRTFSTAASSARTTARAVSTAAWSASMVAARRQLVRADLVVLLARDEAAVDQPPVALLVDHGVLELRRVAGEVRLGLGDLRLMLGELGLRLLERGLEGARVDGEEQVAGRARPGPP